MVFLIIAWRNQSIYRAVLVRQARHADKPPPTVTFDREKFEGAPFDPGLWQFFDRKLCEETLEDPLSPISFAAITKPLLEPKKKCSEEVVVFVVSTPKDQELRFSFLLFLEYGFMVNHSDS